MKKSQQTRQNQIYLRENQLQKARDIFMQCIEYSTKLMGKDNRLLLLPRLFCSEILIRLGKYKEAYQDFLATHSIKNRSLTNYSTLIFVTGYYHAAVIKQKQADQKQSLEHFKDFFSKIKPLCRSILTNQKYQLLESEKAFSIAPYQESNLAEAIKQCFKHSTLIFSTIYCEKHPFVRDYVTVNSKVAP